MTPLIAVAGRTGAPSRVSRDEVAFAGKRYLNSILRAGGEPIVIAPQVFTDDDANELLSRFDALVLMGGPDVDPSLYGQQASPNVYGVSPQQDRFETAMLHGALANELPVLAVCRGMQLTNVVLGGTLVQHLGDFRMPRHSSLMRRANSRSGRSLPCTRWSWCAAAGLLGQPARPASAVRRFIIKASTDWQRVFDR